MKNIMIHTILLSFAVALMGCGGDDSPGGGGSSSVIITVSPETISAPTAGGTYTVNVTTTRNEWGAVADAGSFFTVKSQNTGSSSGTITVTVPENPYTEVRSGTITVMSGTVRKNIAVTQAAAEKATYDAPDGYQLVWHDEFDESGELNSTDWTHEVQKDHWVNNELQNYVNHVSPKGTEVTTVNNGTLKIRCFNEDGKIYSGRVYAHVKEGWKYGYIEASIKLPKGKGTWPAFWMMPVNFRSWPADGEIDIMEEVGADPNQVSSSLHANAHVHSNNTQVTHAMYCAGAEGEFHTYAILWTQQNITTYVDGKVQLSYDNRGLGHDDWPYDAPFYVIFNLAWGGDWGGYKGVDESALPVTMEVDYVRVFQKK
jgi:beta-glucanase (GH16 family)